MRNGQCFSQSAHPHIKRGKKKKGNDEEKAKKINPPMISFRVKKGGKSLFYQGKVEHMETSRTFKYGL